MLRPNESDQEYEYCEWVYTHFRQGQVYCRGKEGRPKGDAACASLASRTVTRLCVELTDLHHKTGKIERILPHQDPASISYHLRQAAQDHQRAKYPCSPLDA